MSVSKEVWVTVDLGDFDTDDLVEELEARSKQRPPHWHGSTVTLESIRDAMALGQTEKVQLLLRSFVQDTLGCILP